MTSATRIPKKKAMRKSTGLKTTTSRRTAEVVAKSLIQVNRLRQEKDEIRKKIWSAMIDKKISRFPPPYGRIPNFQGAEAACERVRLIPCWDHARTLKVNPDSPERFLRQLALEDGKILYMAVPRLRAATPFVRLDPKKLKGRTREASTIRGAMRLGEPVALEDIDTIDLVVCGSVAVNRNGERVGKGGGYSDLELALLTQQGRITERTPVITVVHPEQIIPEKIPMTVHDISLDYVLTPLEVWTTQRTRANPSAIHWELLDGNKIRDIPVLRDLWARKAGGDS